MAGVGDHDALNAQLCSRFTARRSACRGGGPGFTDGTRLGLRLVCWQLAAHPGAQWLAVPAFPDLTGWLGARLGLRRLAPTVPAAPRPMLGGDHQPTRGAFPIRP